MKLSPGVFCNFSVLIFLTLACLTEVSAKSYYRLDTGDLLRIQIYDEEDMYLETRVSDRGTVSYPFLGEIKVSGMPPEELEKLITERLTGDYFIDPKVSVDILEYRQFYVNGEVESPGGFPFQPGLTIRKAISVAGGFKERASREKIYVIHENEPDSDPQKIDLEAEVLPGDIITVRESFF